MSCEIGQKIVGRRVVIETQTGKVTGDVRNVDTSYSKLSLVNGVAVPTGVKLPELYRIYVKDIVSITLADEEVLNSENSASNSSQLPLKSPPHQEKKTKPLLLLSQIEKKGSAVLSPQLTSSSNDRKNQPLVMQKVLPAHIKTLDNSIQTDILTNKVPFTRDGDASLSSTLPNYTIIEEIDGLYNSAIDRLEKESVIGLSMEGIRIGRFGLVCWIGVAMSDHAFLFDVCSLGPTGVKLGLAKILVNDKIVKVTHDCRFMSDAFIHQYGVKLNNVFDTQVGALVVEKKKYGRFSKFVPGLPRCLSDFFSLPSNLMYHPRKRQGHDMEDEAIWKLRPLPQHLVEGAVFNVCWLKRLRLAIMETLLTEVTLGTSLYLKEVGDLEAESVSEKRVAAHLIPMSFKQLASQPKILSSNGDLHEDFHDSVPQNGCDPYVSFTRHISHVRKH